MLVKSTSFFASICFFSTVVIAEEVNSAAKDIPLEMDSLLSMSIEELMDVSITVATKTEKNLNTAPASVTVFTAKDISIMGIKSG